MDFSELRARAPWTVASQPAVQVFDDILAAFAEQHRLHPVTVLRPPPDCGFIINGAAHAWPELFLQISGERSFRFPKATGLLGPGQVALVPRGTEHYERMVDQGRGHACLVWMCHPGRLSLHVAMRDRRGESTSLHGDLYTDTEGAGADRLCDELAVATDPEVQAALLTALLAHARRTIRGTSLHQGGHPPLVDRCLRTLAVHLGDADLGVEELARRLDCHPDHLGRVFRAATGETLVGHLARRRIELAVDLLADGRASVAAVARACGFRDPAYFSRVFRRLRGVSPGVTRAASATRPA